MWTFPLAATLVSAYFAGLLTSQYLQRGRPNLAAWGVALWMFAMASGAAAAGLAFGWSPSMFRLYYLFGAIANVPVLAVGTIYLLGPQRLGHAASAVVAVATLAAAAIVFGAPLEMTGLETDGIPRGSEVLSESVRLLSRYFSITGFLIVVGGALWSSVRLARSRQPHLKRLAAANLLIAGGTTVVAIASEAARIARGSIEGTIFAVGLFVGVSLMFLGFLRTRASRGA